MQIGMTLAVGPCYTVFHIVSNIPQNDWLYRLPRIKGTQLESDKQFPVGVGTFGKKDYLGPIFIRIGAFTYRVCHLGS